MHNKKQVLIAISRRIGAIESYVYQMCIPNFQKQSYVTNLKIKYTNTLLSSTVLGLMVQALAPVCLGSDLGHP